jgi:glycosyltransferase involved in cell wall biosynthesis
MQQPVNLDFIFVASEKWESGNQTSKHHLVRHFLSLGARILYVENISMRSMGSGGAGDVSKALNKLHAFFRGTRSPHENLFCFTPVYVPFPKSPAARRINRKLVPAMIRYHAKAHGLRNPIYVYFMPTGVNLQGLLGERAAAYYIVDNYAAFADVEQEEMRRLELQALQTADVVFATAQTLVDDRKPIRPDILYSPHGVDNGHFAKTRLSATVIPAEVEAIPHPRLGFMGGLAHDSVDLELIRRLAERRPEWHIVLFGRALCDISTLVQMPNVHFLGPKKYDELPAYLKGLDVALIPFLTNELTRDLNPIKLREYLAAGLPTVATDLPAIRPYSQQVACVTTDEEWERAISAAIERPGDPALRQAAVAGESWEARAKSVFEALLAAADRRAGQTGTATG